MRRCRLPSPPRPSQRAHRNPPPAGRVVAARTCGGACARAIRGGASVIALLRGQLVDLSDDHVVIDAGGVGYEVFCHLRTLAALHEHRDREVTLHVHTAVSDDAIRLFGFATPDELRLFRLLISVERIGPKAALGGIGRKTAERVILELRDKLDSLSPGEAPVGPGPSEAVTAAVEGLVGLGFREPEARAAVSAAAAADGDAVEVAELVGAALRRLDAAGSAR
ncbi:MAG: Holliday junction branch migration protein RuvA [Chloroflexi bacterium]|nr:MAG: Holliday junction branch migration protein RuvA [Chloroflexota bacterium]